MKKLSLRIEELDVESFETHLEPQERGTVQAKETPYPWICTADVSCEYGCNTRQDGTCPTANTCDNTCDNTCRTCPGQLGCAPTYYAYTCPPECYD
jgi:hypothetical protein